MSPRPATMKDIARAADVAPSTVSRILSDAPLAIQVSEDTRRRVLETAERMRYRPNPLARALRGAPTMLIGAVVRDITDPFFATAVDALSRHARRHDYSVVLGHAREQADEALALAAVLEARQTDAIVLLGDVGESPRLLADLSALAAPVVSLWHAARGDFAAIEVDNEAAMVGVLGHLAELGHERIAFVGDLDKADVVRRRAAFARVAGDRAPVVAVHNAPEDGARALDRLLDGAGRDGPGDGRPTAIAAATDLLAFGILHRAAERGLRVPEDLSVTGFDDIPLAASAVPALTTARMPIDAMAASAVSLAIGEATAESVDTFTAPLVVRASTGPVRR